ncbi:ABC transporter ATP-binding protein [Tropicibacter naphthalenivorans]|uniref:Lipopolysaccharide export system ATP-binding protein LptB n=1 Tax=Tropicibacter naphthalenivorans TaxID=441103 RepID=A0A0P1GYW8_9RHOB|nr:ATP-binding cassette domain-containing protein [Tropicibacter naphthalenivorans]CUH82271.1 Lipopolysaccharide export system ATP-binding protein LptB [Tropicibacter naphthalenivorans]SMD04662.1 amino acid/amide ABC transporter ATP-binding protein 1, HAAT family [Tropicibacter naphthalenivorans]
MIELSGLTVKFGGVNALDAINATFNAPVNGIIGPNGAGKTTTMNVISGFLKCTGRIAWNGQDIGQMPAHKHTRWGLRRSFQKEQIADDLTIAENLQVILDATPGSRADKRADMERALELTGLTAQASTPAGGLNTFQRRLTDVARCLVGNPKIVKFDEPGDGLSREEANRLGDLILQVPEVTGATVLVIDHDVDLIERICVETLVLDFGKRIAFGPTRAVLDDPHVKAAYLGIEDVE